MNLISKKLYYRVYYITKKNFCKYTKKQIHGNQVIRNYIIEKIMFDTVTIISLNKRK